MKDADREEKSLGGPVAALQTMLRQLAKEYDFLPLVVADGIFGERTLEAVMLFQRELYPPVTGIVDRGTWEAIRAHYLQARRKNAPARPLRVYPPEGMTHADGAEQETMILPQTMFQLLSRQFSGLDRCPANGLNSGQFEKDIRWLQQAGNLPQTGILDRQSWNLLSRLYELFVTGRGETAGFTGGWG